jgi:hypothetical protein
MGQWKPQPQNVMTMKKWIDKQKIKLITRVGGRSEAGSHGISGEGSAGTWKMCVSQYKNYRSRGVDVTELKESNFGWWTALVQSYLEKYCALLVSSSSSKQRKDKHDFLFVPRHGTPFTAW